MTLEQQTASKHYDQAKQLAQVLLKQIHEPSSDDIKKAVLSASQLVMQTNGTTIDEQRLIRDLEALYSSWVGIGIILDDPNTAAHLEWLDQKKETTNWQFWKRYCTYLEQDKGRAPSYLENLDEVTDSILRRLEDPSRSGPWQRRGMVVGHVQSGKTGNYTGLICKAADAGYKLIVVLAGIHNSLRSQTQRRLDEEFLGFDSRVHRAFDLKKSSRIKAGLIPTSEFLIANSATSSDQNGDFNKSIARQYNLVPGGNHPVLLVVKKNRAVLENVIKWALAHRSVDAENGKRIVRGIPLLIIDDEADQASINTDPIPYDDQGNIDLQHDPTKINGKIRELLNSFEQNAYVGYTATPFANIFIHPDARATEYGDDLFPESFIVSLSAPSDYIGPATVFGLNRETLDDESEKIGSKTIKTVEDQDIWLPIGHKKGFEPTVLPPSLKEAIKVFLLVCAIRQLRKQDAEHNSMLIHVTRFKEVQSRVTELVNGYLRDLKNRIRYMEQNSSDDVMLEFETVFESEFSTTADTAAIKWEEVAKVLPREVARVLVKTINGESVDVLDYCDSPKPLSVIAIGGNKLSRGLTLEGLSVSYYLRASRMYDTLMQMGRWFGYRPGYADLCRLYTSEELIGWYRHIAVATEELRGEFEEMAARSASPRDFGLRVRSHPSGLDVTAVNKMRNSIRMDLSYDGTTNESVTFKKAQLEENLETLKRLLHSIKSSGTVPKFKSNRSVIWNKVDPMTVLDFLTSIKVPEDSRRCRGELMASYIEKQLSRGELDKWTVSLISTSKGKPYVVDGLEIGLIEREAQINSPTHYTIRKLVSPVDETIDLSEAQLDLAIAESRAHRVKNKLKSKSENVPLSWVVRKQRSKEQGLLLIYLLDPEQFDGETPAVGFAVCFPSSLTAEKIEYRVNNPYWEQEFGRD